MIAVNHQSFGIVFEGKFSNNFFQNYITFSQKKSIHRNEVLTMQFTLILENEIGEQINMTTAGQ